jgi:GT2 family glycosyltransferase
VTRRDWPLVTVNVLAHDRRAAVERTLRAVLSLDYPRERLEVVLVDNGSRDGTAAMVRGSFPGVTVVERAENVGVSGWNDGFARGRGDWFLVLDDDCRIEGDALRRAISAAEAHEADLVSFSVASAEDPGFRFERRYATGLLLFWGCAALISRRAVRSSGGFDPAIFVWAHEVEFTMRLLDAGLRHLYLPDVVAVHEKPPAAVDAPGRFAEVTNLRNLAYVAARLLAGPDAVTAAANLLLRGVIEGALQRAPELTLAVARGLLAGVRRRRPVGRAVSRLYRRHFVEFRSPLLFVRGPRTRRSGLSATEAIARRRLAFADARPAYYPRTAASLRL